jgi:hypothetical protein
MINSRAEAIIFLFLWVTLAASCPSALAQNSFQVFEAPKIPYHIVNSYPVGGPYKWGGIALDSQHKRIYVAHYSRVEVLDQDSGHRVGDLLDVPDVRTIAIASNLNRGFTANGGSDRRTDDRGSVTIFDTSTLESLSKVPVHPPESVVYDAFTKRVFALSSNTTVIDARSGSRVGDISLNGEPAGAVSDGNGTVFVNLSDKKAVAVIDAKTLQITKVLPVSHCVGPQQRVL